MISLRLVLDANVIVSAALNPRGLEHTVLLLATSRPLLWFVSQEILAEYALVLARPELKIRKGLRLKLVQLARNHARLVRLGQFPEVTKDPDDNAFVACADAARADYLVTGNRRHFPTHWKNTKIITARQFLELIAPHLVS
jgi:uncharacterized protein